MDLFVIDVLKFTSKGMNFESNVKIGSIESQIYLPFSHWVH